jgi:hypothetical protein
MKKIILLLSLVFICGAEQRAGGILTVNTRWDADEGPFILERDLVIPEGVRLTIAPGTNIIIAPSPIADTSNQIDRTDSLSISIKVLGGALICVGRRDKQISFSPSEPQPGRHSWYGIILNAAEEPFTEIAFTEISGAYCALSIMKCSPVIRNSILEYNYLGINCINKSSPQILNCVICRNFASGIKTRESNPFITSSIIAFNSNTGVWCDGLSKINFEYNCVHGNGDGNLLDCDPELGILTKTNKNKDSCDLHFNLYRDPVFAGSLADSIALEKDISVPTKKSRIKNHSLARIIHNEDTAKQEVKAKTGKYSLSNYSPCINAGNPADRFKDADGSKNDMGVEGGREFYH